MRFSCSAYLEVDKLFKASRDDLESESMAISFFSKSSWFRAVHSKAFEIASISAPMIVMVSFPSSFQPLFMFNSGTQMAEVVESVTFDPSVYMWR